jgi:hypothetical protein
MTTNDVVTEADRDGISTADMNLNSLLRQKVVPAFLYDIGYVSWRRKYSTHALSQGSTFIDISADDVGHIRHVAIAPDTRTPLRYIGEDDGLVLAAISNTAQAKPGGYFLRTDGNHLKRLCFDAPADTAYTIAVAYDLQIKFPDLTTSVNLDQYMPRHCQWPLVEALRMEIYERRFGVGDSRYQRAEAEYAKWLGRITENKEHAKDGGARGFVR